MKYIGVRVIGVGGIDMTQIGGVDCGLGEGLRGEWGVYICVYRGTGCAQRSIQGED